MAAPHRLSDPGERSFLDGLAPADIDFLLDAVDGFSSSSSPAASLASQDAVATTNDRRRGKSSSLGGRRPRLREELNALRRQVQGLESELLALEQAAATEYKTQEEPRSSDAVESKESAAWEQLAKRQRSAKLLAQAENRKLKEQLIMQRKLTRQVEKLLHKASHLDHTEL